MSSARYTSLRDGTAANLIQKFGRAATLRQQSSTYDPATGSSTITETDTAVLVIETSLGSVLKGAGGSNKFTEEMVSQWDSGILMSAKETAAAGVEPQENDILVLDGSEARIMWVDPKRPSGFAIVYKMAISRK